jgi:hypothetical protein
MADNYPSLGPGFASAVLAKKKRDLAVAQAKAAQDLNMSDIGRQYYNATRNLEGNLEARGILRSGEANTARVSLGAEEKAARARALMSGEQAINQAELDYASALAQAKAQDDLSNKSTSSTPDPDAPPAGQPAGGKWVTDANGKRHYLPPGINFAALAGK